MKSAPQVLAEKLRALAAGTEHEGERQAALAKIKALEDKYGFKLIPLDPPRKAGPGVIYTGSGAQGLAGFMAKRPRGAVPPVEDNSDLGRANSRATWADQLKRMQQEKK